MQKTCAEAKQDEIHAKLETSTRISLARLAEQTHVSALSVSITIRLLYLHPTITTAVHKLCDMRPQIHTDMLSCDHLSDYSTAFFVAKECNTHIANNSMPCSETIFGDRKQNCCFHICRHLDPRYFYLCHLLKDKVGSNNSCT
jgi:hypothetical protein